MFAIFGIFAIQFSRFIKEIPKIATFDENTDRLPLISSLSVGLISKCLFGWMGAKLIDLKSDSMLYQQDLYVIECMTIIFVVCCAISRISSDQKKVGYALISAGISSVSFEIYVLVYIVPWVICAFIHNSDFIFQCFSLIGISLTLLVCYILPFCLWMNQTAFANEIKINFKDSVRMIFEGDKRSLKETHILPKEIEYMFDSDFIFESESNLSKN